MHVLGRPATVDGPTARLGSYRAPDGSTGASVGVDLDRPHAAFVVGKRGTGKSYTLGVLAEAAARTAGIAPVVVDPMGVFGGLAEGGRTERAAVPARVRRRPTVAASALPPTAWPDLVDLDPSGGPGALVGEAAREADSLTGMCEYVADSTAPESARRAATNGLERARSWDVFDPDGLGADALFGGEATVLDCAGLTGSAMGAVCAAVASTAYDARITGRFDRLPWLFLDEAHALFGGVADGPLRTVLTRGRAPGVSLVAATQRPAALPPVALSQADLLVSHRLTSEADLDALRAARPTYLDGSWDERLPEGVGEALVVDDATESVHGVRVRERDTPHEGESPRTSERSVESARRAERGGSEAESDGYE